MFGTLPLIINLMFRELRGKSMKRTFVDTAYKAFNNLARQKL